MQITVHNLITEEQNIYSGLSKEDALISDYMIRNKMVSQLTNSEERDKVRAKIEKCGPNGRTLTIGDLAVTTIK